VLVAATCLLLACAGEPAARSLAWERAPVLHGQAWRLWTGHLVHFSVSHATTDALALLAAGWLAEPVVGPRRYALVLLAGAALLSLGLAGMTSSVDYRGASGLAMLAATLAGALAWRRHAGLRTWLGCAAAALAATIVCEANGQALLAELPLGVSVAWQVHLMAALLGCGASVAIDRGTAMFGVPRRLP
jgi:membrane associated rhomboid family serine protease